MIKIVEIFQLSKYQIIIFEKQPDHNYRWLKLGDKIYKPITVHDAKNSVAIESDDDISNTEYIEFLETI